MDSYWAKGYLFYDATIIIVQEKVRPIVIISDIGPELRHQFLMAAIWGDKEWLVIFSRWEDWCPLIRDYRPGPFSKSSLANSQMFDIVVGGLDLCLDISFE